jgi:hypothetical protein
MSEPVEHDGRHFFIVLEHLGVEADRLGIRAVDAYGKAMPVSEFLDTVMRYILAREKECDNSRPTDEEREAIEKAISRELDCDWYGGPEPARVVTLRGMLERTK